MAENITLSPRNDTASEGFDTSAVLGLAVGLPLTLLGTAAVIVAVLYTKCYKSKRISDPQYPSKTKDVAQYVPNPRYVTTSEVVPPSHQQSPVYENFSSGFQRNSPNRQYDTVERVPPRAEFQTDDLYLSCDQQDEAIYSNDPSFRRYSSDHDPSHEDEYVLPDVL